MSTSTHPQHRTAGLRRPATALALAVALGLVTGCGSGDSPDAGADADPGTAELEQTPAEEVTGEEVVSVYTGPYDEEFRANVTSYAGEQVTLTGEVSELVPSRSSLVLTSTEDPDLDPFLVSAQYAFPEAEQGAVVEVTGILRNQFQARIDQDDQDNEAGFYDRHVGEPYLDQAALSTEP
ncbi:hypothetical protein ACH9DO_10610 [Kocuria sp. M1N1S27]|uniref:hypothetical protein n=1 Tax=Kocuria kalidii TaxID=3376283 RepID=UPI0037A2F448